MTPPSDNSPKATIILQLAYAALVFYYTLLYAYEAHVRVRLYLMLEVDLISLSIACPSRAEFLDDDPSYMPTRRSYKPSYNNLKFRYYECRAMSIDTKKH